MLTYSRHQDGEKVRVTASWEGGTELQIYIKDEGGIALESEAG
jgi:hypothetical protein